MLTHLHIENYALIRETDISFDRGFVVITGETGAGKSILLGALGLLLGQRADSGVLADADRKCVVEAQFDIANLGLEPLFSEADVDYDDPLVLRREILPSGKSRAFVNDTPVQLPFLKALGPHIVDIHSQHQTLTLADSHFRFALLDTIGAHEASQTYSTAYRHYQDLKRQLEELTTIEAQNRRDQDYLQFQYDELAAAALVADEQEALEQESRLLAHAEAVREGLATAATLLDDDSEQAILSRLRSAKSALAHIASYHPDSEALLQRLDSALIELDDIERELQHTADAVNFSPERQQQVDERLKDFERFANGEIFGQKKLIRNLSAGNKMKVGIISALLRRPEIVILDEPFNFLDPTSQLVLKHLLTDYAHETGSTILISSHNLQHTIDISTRIALLEKGHIVKDLQNEAGSAEAELEQYFSVE